MSLKGLSCHPIVCLALFLWGTSLSANDPIADDEYGQRHLQFAQRLDAAQLEERRIQKAHDFVAVYGEPQNFDPPIDQPDFLTVFSPNVPRTFQIMIGGVVTGVCAIGLFDIGMIFVRLVQFYFSEPGDERFAYRPII